MARDVIRHDSWDENIIARATEQAVLAAQRAREEAMAALTFTSSDRILIDDGTATTSAVTTVGSTDACGTINVNAWDRFDADVQEERELYHRGKLVRPYIDRLRSEIKYWHGNILRAA